MFNLNSTITNRVLRFFFINSGEKGYVNELARILEVDPGNLSRKLKELESEGVLISEFSGKQRYYFLNKKYPLLKEAKKIFEIKYGLAEQIAKRLRAIKGVKEAYIFGSYAKGDFEAESDIDVLLIGSHSVFSAQEALRPLEKRIGREINIADLAEEEFKKKQKARDEFVADIFRGKTIKIL